MYTTSLVLLASVSFAQNTIIGLPTAGFAVPKGGNVIVQLERLVCCVVKIWKAK